MFLPVAPWWLLLVVLLGWAFNNMWKKATKTRLVEIKYDDLSEKRKQKARDRAEYRGFIYLGEVKQQIDYGTYWYMTPEENVVCRHDGENICFYSIGDKTNFFEGVDNPKLLPFSISIRRIVNIQAWYQPGESYASLRIDLRQLPGFGCEFVDCWTSYHSKKSMTDALVLIQERVETYLEKHH